MSLIVSCVALVISVLSIIANVLIYRKYLR